MVGRCQGTVGTTRQRMVPVRGDALLLATRRGGGRRYKPRIVTVLVRDGLPLEVVDNDMTAGEETTAAQKMRELPSLQSLYSLRRQGSLFIIGQNAF